MGRVGPSPDDVAEVVADFRRLAEANRQRHERTDGEYGDLMAADVYEDAANHVAAELLDTEEGGE